MEKTYRDFVNQVIAEANGRKSAFDEWLASRHNNKKQEVDYQKVLKIYAQAFTEDQDDAIWDEFIEKLKEYYPQNPTQPSPTGSGDILIVTKYQFMKAFFNYYLNVVYNSSIKEIKQCLSEAAQTIGIDEKYYKRGMIRKVLKLLSSKNKQKYKSLFVQIYNDLKGY